LHSTKLLDTTKKPMLFSSMVFSSKWENMFHVNCVKDRVWFSILWTRMENHTSSSKRAAVCA
jgi:hypothetical protein